MVINRCVDGVALNHFKGTAEAMHKFGITLAAFCLLSCCALAADSTSCDTLISVNSHRLEVHQEGTGTPVVVFDAGLSDQLDKLRPLQARIARVTRTITYNRAGYGRSEAGPMPRSAEQEVEELKTLLERVSGKGPYVLVGHSLGALNVQVFASKYQDMVAGMILMDPPPNSFIMGRKFQDLREMAEKMTAEWQAIADSSMQSGDANAMATHAFFSAIISEHRKMFGESGKLVNAISSFGDIPLVVMASGKPNPAFGDDAEEFQKFWIEQSRALSKKSTRGEFILVKESSHYIYLDKPELVADTILSVVRRIRGN